MQREGFDVARCTVQRLMRDLGLQGVIRGKPVRTTISDKTAPCPLDQVNRQFHAPAPDRLWLSGFTYVATWVGFVYVAFVIDAYARRIVGWRASRTAHAGFVLDALEQALHDRRPLHGGGLIHHSDRGSQYVSIKYTERLAEAGIEPSVGSVGDSYDNALAETINGLYKAEVIHRRGPWRSYEAVEFATLEWVDWFNNRRLLEPIGNIPPAEAEANYYAALDQPAMAAKLRPNGLRQSRRGSLRHSQGFANKRPQKQLGTGDGWSHPSPSKSTVKGNARVFFDISGQPHPIVKHDQFEGGEVKVRRRRRE